MKLIIDSSSRYLSKKLNLDVAYFAKGSFWLSLNQFFSSLRYLILSVILASVFTKELYGQYSFILTAIGIAGAFCLPEMGLSIVNAVSKAYEKNFKHAIYKVIQYGLIGSAFLLITACVMFYRGDILVSIVLISAAVIFPFHISLPHYASFYIGKQAYRTLFFVKAPVHISLIIYSLVAVYIFESLFLLIIGTIVLNIIYDSIIVLLIFKKMNKQFNLEIFSMPFKTNISAGINQLAARFDLFIMPFILSFEELAIYTIVTLLPNQMKIFTNLINPMLLPKLNTNKFGFKSAFLKLFLVSLILITGYILLSPLIFNLFYPNYSDYLWMSILFSISFITYPSILYKYTLISKNKIGALNLINFVSAGSNTLLVLIGMVFFGLTGAIVAKILYRVTIFLITYIAYEKM